MLRACAATFENKNDGKEISEDVVESEGCGLSSARSGMWYSVLIIAPSFTSLHLDELDLRPRFVRSEQRRRVELVLVKG
jgi:hypothetical protein